MTKWNHLRCFSSVQIGCVNFSSFWLVVHPAQSLHLIIISTILHSIIKLKCLKSLYRLGSIQIFVIWRWFLILTAKDISILIFRSSIEISCMVLEYFTCTENLIIKYGSSNISSFTVTYRNESYHWSKYGPSSNHTTQVCIFNMG